MTTKTRLTLLAATGLCAALALPAGAQDLDHRQADDFAAWLVDDGQHAKAAGLYAEAYDERSRPVYAHEAAELYFAVKDYAKAARYYAAVAKNSDYPQARLQLARAQMRMGDYAAARATYAEHREKYVREDSAAVRATIKAELASIDYAEAERVRVDPTVFADKLGGSVNGMKNEICPMPLDGGRTLAFVSDFDGTMRAYATSKGRNGWSQMAPADDIPVVEDAHIGGGTLVGDDRFYFARCATSELVTQPTAACQIYVVTRRGGAWGEPKALPGNINLEGSTALQPYVFEQDGKEVMLFASDRPGGQGAMDIWRAERDLAGDVTVFGTPVNLGEAVNGPGNEVTPFYNPETRVLSFSTDGATVMGGYDVYQATATGQGLAEFKPAVNAGSPVNSVGDDYYYREVVGTSQAYVASNRGKDPAKTNLVNDDIFEVTYDNPNVTVEVLVVEDGTGKPLTDVTLTASVDPDGHLLKPMVARRSLDGYFTLTLPVDRDVTVEIERPYFDDDTAAIYLPVGSRDGHEIEPLRLKRTPVGADDLPVVSRGVATDDDGVVVKRKIMTATADEEN